MEISGEKIKRPWQIYSFDDGGGRRFEWSYSANLVSGCNGGHRQAGSCSLSQSIALVKSEAVVRKDDINGPDQHSL